MKQQQRRFIGAFLPLDVFEAFEGTRAERGIATRSEAVLEAIVFWLTMKPPTTGIRRTIAEAVQLVSTGRAARAALDAAIWEWRMSKNEELLVRIVELAAQVKKELPPDIQDYLASKK